MNTVTTINDIQVSIISYNSVPVITTEKLAQLYETEVTNIKKNFSINSSRFEEGKHFFKLEGKELREFKNMVTQSNHVGDDKSNIVNNVHHVNKHVARLILWTERGAARHAKMLETDQAWDIFEKLEDNYFNHGEKSHLPNAEYNLELLEKELAFKVIKYHNELNQEIVRLGGKMPENYPDFNRETICKAYMTHFLHNSRIRMILDYDGIPKLDLIPKESYVVNEENIVDVIGANGAIRKELLPKIIKVAAERLG